MNPKLLACLGRVRPPALPTGIVGHRGASALAPENTVASFRAALDAGCDVVELDVLVTRDEELAVLHDEKLGRTTDRRGRVEALTLEEIQACDAGGWFDEGFRGERVPDLHEALAAIERRAIPMIELKQKSARAPALVPKLARALAEHGYTDRAIVIAWDDATGHAVRAALPDVLIARIAFTRLAIRRAAGNGFDGVVPWRASATQRFISDAQRAGLFVAPWTVNRTKDMDFFVRTGCDLVITDHPCVLRERIEADVVRRALALSARIDAPEGQAATPAPAAPPGSPAQASPPPVDIATGAASEEPLPPPSPPRDPIAAMAPATPPATPATATPARLPDDTQRLTAADLARLNARRLPPRTPPPSPSPKPPPIPAALGPPAAATPAPPPVAAAPSADVLAPADAALVPEDAAALERGTAA